MKAKIVPCICTLVATVLGFACVRANAQLLPPDYPGVTVTTCDTNAVGDGYIFLNVSETSTNVGFYAMILRNDGTPVWYQPASGAAADFKVLPDGFLHNAVSYHTLSWTGGADVYHQILDNSYALRETIPAGNGYLPESHEIQVLPNGNVLSLSYYQSYMNLAQFVTGAYPNALVAGAVIQELDAQRNVVWQWRSWDHYAFQTYYAPVLAMGAMATARNPVVDSFHLNSITMDTDGNLLISNFMVDVQKINRQTGAVMWRLGGWGNQFTFVGENPAQAAAHFSGHTLSRLANGNILIFCNADQQSTRPSKVYEYQLDEVNKVATLVWSYTPATPWYSWHAGSAQRLPNGNTFIGWGGGGVVPGIGGIGNHQVPACTEVTPSGQVVYEMMFNDPLVASYRAFRFAYPPQAQATTVVQTGLTVGNTSDFGAAGVALTVTAGGGGYNSLTVTREQYAPVYPMFQAKPPRVLPTRVSMVESGLNTLGADIDFDVATFGITNPANTTVYYRASTGQGIFVSQPTDYNPALGKLRISMDLAAQGSDFGEFIFGYPDVAEVAYPPILNAVENYRGVQLYEVIAPLQATTGAVYSVNQTLPISLSWSPKGFAAEYQLQIATNQDFANPVVEIPSQTDAFYVWSNASPATTYYYRVNTSNDGGTGAWSVGSFQTAAPFVQVTVPNGGEAWRRGLSYFVQWNDNLAENVRIDLYKGGLFVKNLTTNTPSTGAIKWSVPGSSLTNGSDYTIKITSVTDSGLSSTSAQSFSIVDVPVINSATPLPAGQVQFGFTAPGAAQATIWGTATLTPTSWQNLGKVAVTEGNGTFTNTLPYLFYRVSLP